MTACDGGGDQPEPLTVSAAASLGGALEAYGSSFEDGMRVALGGSGQLAAQIRQGAKPDVFASASPTYPRALAREGLAGEPVEFARNRLVLIAAPGAGIDSLAELEAPGTDLVIGAEGVPVGDYARALIERLPPDRGAAIIANVRSRESDVRGVVGKVVQGAADAGFVYASDAGAAEPEVVTVEIPEDLSPRVTYSAAVVEGSSEPQRARAFVDGLTTAAGRRALIAAGLSPISGGRR